MAYKKFFLFLILGGFILIPLAVGARSEDWKLVTNAAHGYSIEIPASAEAVLHQPEGILRIILESQQVISLHYVPDDNHQVVEQWVQATFLDSSLQGVEPMVSNFPVTEQASLQVAGQPAYRMVVLGPVESTFRVVVTHPEGGFLVISGPQEAESTFTERILSSLKFGPMPADQGLQVQSVDASQNIADLPVPMFKQTDPQWGCDQLGTCWCWGGCGGFTSIADAGCYVSAEAMVFSYYAPDYANPKELDDCLIQHGGYGYWEGCGYGLCGASYDAVDACQPKNVQYASLSGDLSLLDHDLQNGYPAIAWVDYSTHYVVVIGKTNGMYDVNDPLYYRTQIQPGWITYVIRYHGEVIQPTPSATQTPKPMPTIDPSLTEHNFLPVCIKDTP